VVSQIPGSIQASRKQKPPPKEEDQLQMKAQELNHSKMITIRALLKATLQEIPRIKAKALGKSSNLRKTLLLIPRLEEV
jgi:hypothetical protein